MINASDYFKQALLSPVSEVYVKMELMDKNENVIDVFTNRVNSDSVGDISISSDRDIRRMFTLTLDNSDGKFTWNEGKLIWLDNKRVKLYLGLKTLDGIEYVPEGVFVITQPEATHKPLENTVTLSGQDKWYLLTGNFGRFVNETTITSGTNIKEAIKIIAQGAGITKMILDDTDIDVPYDLTYQIGQNRGQAIKDLASKAFSDGEFFYDVYFDVNGYLRFEKYKDPLLEASCWTYKIEDTTLYSGSNRKMDDSELYNHILVLGGSGQTASFRTEVIIDELTSSLKRLVSNFKTTGTKLDTTTDSSKNLKLTSGKTSGSYTSPVLDVSVLGNSVSVSKLDFVHTLGKSIKDETHTGITYETNVSFDSGETWIGWKPYVRLNDPIADLGNGVALENVRLQYRVNFSFLSMKSPYPLCKSVNIVIEVYDSVWVGHPYSIQTIGDRFFAYNNGNPDSNIDTQSQCDARAKFELNKRLSFFESVTLEFAPNYLHEVNDVVEIIDDKNGCVGNYQLKSFSIPIKPKIVSAEVKKVRNGLV